MVSSFITDNKLVAIAIAGFSILYVYRKTRTSAPLPPGPPQALLVGNAFQLPKERAWIQYAEWAKQYGKSYLDKGQRIVKNSPRGDIVHVRAFNQHVIILGNYEDATKLMHEAKYSDRMQTVMLHDLYVSITIPTASLILFYNRMAFNWGVTPMPYGPEWRFCRKLLHEQFNRHEVVHYATQQEASTRVMLQDLLSTPNEFSAHVHKWDLSSMTSLSIL